MGPLREVVLVILAALLACTTTTGDGPFERASAAMAKGDMAAVDAEIAALGDPLSQDMLRVRLAAVEPQKGAHFCAAVTTEYGKAKCQQVLGRPHLQSIKP